MNWQAVLKKWSDENPPTLPELAPWLTGRDTSGSMSRETMDKLAAETDELIASGELKLVYIRMDDDENLIVEDEYGHPI